MPALRGRRIGGKKQDAGRVDGRSVASFSSAEGGSGCRRGGVRTGQAENSPQKGPAMGPERQVKKGARLMSTKKILLVDDSYTARLVNRMIFSQKTNYT